MSSQEPEKGVWTSKASSLMAPLRYQAVSAPVPSQTAIMSSVAQVCTQDLRCARRSLAQHR